MTETRDLSLFVKRDADGISHMDLAVEGVGCAGCIRKIENGLKELPGVTEARLNFTNRRLAVGWRDKALDAAKVIDALDRIGYRAHPFEAGRAESDEARQARWLMRCLAVAGFAAMNIMLLSVAVWSGSSDMTPETRDLFHWLSALIALPAAAYAGQPFFRSAWNALRTGRTNMDVPISLGVTLALGMSVIETINHAHHAYFDSAIMLLFFLLCGRYLDHAMRRKTRAVAGNLAALKAEVAHRFEKNGEIVIVPVAALKPGDRLLRPSRRAHGGRRRRRQRRVGDRREPGDRRNRAAAGRGRRLDPRRQPEFQRRPDRPSDGGGLGYAHCRGRAASGEGGRGQIPISAAGRPRRALLCAGRARDGRADRDRLAPRRRFGPRRRRDRDRRAHHHLPVRARARHSGGPGGCIRRDVPQRRHSQQRRRHRAAGRGRYDRVRQDRHAHPARTSGRQCRRD